MRAPSGLFQGWLRCDCQLSARRVSLQSPEAPASWRFPPFWPRGSFADTGAVPLLLGKIQATTVVTQVLVRPGSTEACCCMLL